MVLGLSKDIKIKLGDSTDCVQTVSVEVPASKVKENIEKAFHSVQSQAKLPGFRPGKTPIELVKKNFKDTAYARAQDSLLREGVSEALKQKNIRAIESPVIQSVKFDPEKSFQFEFRVEVVPEFKLASYKGIKLTDESKTVTESELDERLKQLAESNATLIESKAESLEESHHAVLNYEGFIDGKPIDDMKAEGFLLDMAAPQMITGLTEGLKGGKPGEEKEISVKFPEDSPAKTLAGKEGLFKTKLVAIKEKKVPALDDEFAKDMGAESLADLKKQVKEAMQKEADRRVRAKLEKQVIDKLLADNKFSVPQTLIQRQFDNLIGRQKMRLARNGLSAEDQQKFLEAKGAELRKQAEDEVRLAYILNLISDQEKLSVSDADISAKIDEILSRSTASERNQMEKMLKGPYKEQIESELRDTKIFDYLISNAKVKK